MAMMLASGATPEELVPSPAAIPATCVPCQHSAGIVHAAPAPSPIRTK